MLLGQAQLGQAVSDPEGGLAEPGHRNLSPSGLGPTAAVATTVPPWVQGRFCQLKLTNPTRIYKRGPHFGITIPHQVSEWSF